MHIPEEVPGYRGRRASYVHVVHLCAEEGLDRCSEAPRAQDWLASTYEDLSRRIGRKGSSSSKTARVNHQKSSGMSTQKELIRLVLKRIAEFELVHCYDMHTPVKLVSLYFFSPQFYKVFTEHPGMLLL
ncbi:hypothetical protein V2G26_018586 [Clonostachys chloroleuca]